MGPDMNLRWLITCDKNGVKSDPGLQLQNIEAKEWQDVPIVECKVWEETNFNQKC